MLKGITLDVGGTLAEGGLDKKAFMASAVDYLRGLGHGVDEKSYRRALGRAMNKLEKLRASGRDMYFHDFYSLVLSGLGIRPQDEILDGLLELYFKHFISTPVPGMREVIEELASSYALAVISNAVSPWPRRFLEREGLARYFEAIVISGEVGWKKPHRRIFEEALSRLGLEPWEVAHVGDSPEDDVMGARNIGMKAILVLRPGRSPLVLEEADAVIGSLSELPEALKRLDP